jgi:hypothetical protein
MKEKRKRDTRRKTSARNLDTRKEDIPQQMATPDEQ